MKIFHLSVPAEYLPRIENGIRIKRLLDLTHQIDGIAELLLQKCHLPLPYAVLAGACAVHGERTRVKASDEFLDDRDPFRGLVVKQDEHMEITVAGMADDRRQQAMRLDIGLGFRYAFGKA